jgi:hypothetical protein
MPFPGSEELLAAAETILGRRLPPHHRARLVADNGGAVEAAGDDWQLFPVWDPTDRRTMGRTANHIVRENAALADWPGIPAGFLAIAANGTGDMLGLLPDDENIHHFDHETGSTNVVDVRWRLT